MPVTFKHLLSFVAVYLFLWWLLGSGVPWYAFPALGLLPVLIGYCIDRPETLLGKEHSSFSKYFMRTSLCLFFFFNLTLHFYDTGLPQNQHLIFRTPNFQYATQHLNQEEIVARFNPSYAEALSFLNQNPSDKIYRVGTFLQYHISQNDQRVLEDNQLGKYDEVTAKLSDPNYFISVLKQQGFRFIIYDLNTANIDLTPEQSLKKKSLSFVNQLLDPNAIRLRVTDRILEDPNSVIELPDGTINGRYGLSGKIIFPGSFALFEIL